MEQKKLSQLEAGETFEGFVIIKNASVKTGQTGKNYMEFNYKRQRKQHKCQDMGL